VEIRKFFEQPPESVSRLSWSAWVKQSLYTPWRRLGERRYSSYSFSTSALGGGEWSASRPGRALPTGKDPRYTLYRRLGGPQSRSGHRGYRKNPSWSAGVLKNITWAPEVNLYNKFQPIVQETLSSKQFRTSHWRDQVLLYSPDFH
jgi:hypothetical protein